MNVIKLGLVITSMFVSFAVAAEDKKPWQAHPERGIRLSEKLCASCHQVHRHLTSELIAGVPSFHALAALPKQTAQHIKNTLMVPHMPMPNMQLTRHEIADIIAYIESLRPGHDAPDSTEPQKKPAYPSPS